VNNVKICGICLSEIAFSFNKILFADMKFLLNCVVQNENRLQHLTSTNWFLLKNVAQSNVATEMKDLSLKGIARLLQNDRKKVQISLLPFWSVSWMKRAFFKFKVAACVTTKSLREPVFIFAEH
jgi:hypothetical protein